MIWTWHYFQWTLKNVSLYLKVIHTTLLKWRYIGKITIHSWLEKKLGSKLFNDFYIYNKMFFQMVGNERLPDFLLIKFNTSQRRTDYTAGNWDQLFSKFIFKRQRGYYILQVEIKYFLELVLTNIITLGLFTNLSVCVYILDCILD